MPLLCPASFIVATAESCTHSEHLGSGGRSEPLRGLGEFDMVTGGLLVFQLIEVIQGQVKDRTDTMQQVNMKEVSFQEGRQMPKKVCRTGTMEI